MDNIDLNLCGVRRFQCIGLRWVYWAVSFAVFATSAATAANCERVSLERPRTITKDSRIVCRADIHFQIENYYCRGGRPGTNELYGEEFQKCRDEVDDLVTDNCMQELKIDLSKRKLVACVIPPENRGTDFLKSTKPKPKMGLDKPAKPQNAPNNGDSRSPIDGACMVTGTCP